MGTAPDEVVIPLSAGFGQAEDQRLLLPDVGGQGACSSEGDARAACKVMMPLPLPDTPPSPLSSRSDHLPSRPRFWESKLSRILTGLERVPRPMAAKAETVQDDNGSKNLTGGKKAEW